MAAFQDTREQTEQKVMVHLLSEIERNPRITQRSLAGNLGIALGLMNQYLKRSINKGLIRASQVSPKRISYFLTPEGFKEKSVMVRDYLARSMSFFRDAKNECEVILTTLSTNKINNIALFGQGDLAEIALLVSRGYKFEISVLTEIPKNDYFEAYIITDILDPQGSFDALSSVVAASKIITPVLLHISREAK
jgi:hypothetical protein